MIEIKAQYSMEFILVFAFSVVIIIPLINLMHTEYSRSKENLDQSQVARVLDDISMSVHNTYYSGFPTRTTLELYFPRGIDKINHTNIETAAGSKSELVFYLKLSQGREREAPRVFPFNISVNLQPNDGRRKVLIKAEKNNYVNITDLK